MHIRRDILLQNRKQIRNYNDFKKCLPVWEKWGGKRGILVFLVWVPLKMIKGVKNMPKFRDFLFIGSDPMWVPHLWEERSDFLREKIILGEISVVALIQMDFNDK